MINNGNMATLDLSHKVNNGQDIHICHRVLKTSDLQPQATDKPTHHTVKKTNPPQKQPHRLEKYFDPKKEVMCFRCKEWGHESRDCPGKPIHRVALMADDDCFAMFRLDGKLVCAQVDNGAATSLVWKELVPEPPQCLSDQTSCPSTTIDTS